MTYARKSVKLTSNRTKLRENTSFRVLCLLKENPEMSQRELARVAGVSVGGMHYMLTALVDKGLIKFRNFQSAEDKRRYAYVLTPKGIARRAALTRAFLAHKMNEYEALKCEIEKLRLELDVAKPAKSLHKS